MQYRRLIRNFDAALKELKAAGETAVTCTDLSAERRAYIHSKLQMIRTRIANLEKQVIEVAE